MMDTPINFGVWGPNSFFQAWCSCLVWDFKPAIDLQTIPPIVHVGELLEENAVMTAQAFFPFSLNILGYWQFFFFFFNFLMALWHFALQTLQMEATLYVSTGISRALSCFSACLCSMVFQHFSFRHEVGCKWRSLKSSRFTFVWYVQPILVVIVWGRFLCFQYCTKKKDLFEILFAVSIYISRDDNFCEWLICDR